MSCLIIAEMANAHEGNFETATSIVAAAATAGADAVKFQVFSAEELAAPDFRHFAMYRSLQFSPSQWSDLVSLGKERGLAVYADIFGFEGAALMDGLGIDGFMIHAADLQNGPLLRVVGQCHRHTILSMAGSTRSEIEEALDTLDAAGAPSVLLMHGFQNYPTALVDSHLRRIRTLQEIFQRRVGFASHLDGEAPEAPWLAAWAASAGADAVEIHLTLDRSKKGLDYFSSLDPVQFSVMVGGVRAADTAMGSGAVELTTPEITYRNGHRKSLVTMRDVAPGEPLREADLGYRRINNAPTEPSPSLRSVLGRCSSSHLAPFSPILDHLLS